MAPKRSAAGRAASPSPKKAKSDPSVGEKIRKVTKALKDEDQCAVEGPASNRAMLVEAVGFVLKCTVEERHSYQTAVAQMIGKELAASKSAWQKQADEAAASVASHQAEKDAAEAAVAAANSAVETATTAIASGKADVKSAKDSEKQAKDSLAAAVKDVKNHDSEYKEKAEAKTDLDDTFEKSFIVLKTLGVDAEAAPMSATAKKGHARKIVSALKGLKAEPSLVQAVDSAIMKNAPERGSFDAMAVEGVEQFLQAKIAEKQKELDGGEATKAEKEKTKVAAEATVEAATAKIAEFQEKLKASEEDKATKSSALDAAKDELSAKEKALGKCQKDSDKVKEGLDAASEASEAFKYLFERKNPAPEPEAPAP